MSEHELLETLGSLERAVERGSIEEAAQLMAVFVAALTQAPQQTITPAVVKLARGCEAKVYAAHAKLRAAVALHATSVRAQTAYGWAP